MTLRTDADVFYRYCVCVILHVDGQRKVIARRWETDLAPRRIPLAGEFGGMCCCLCIGCEF